MGAVSRHGRLLLVAVLVGAGVFTLGVPPAGGEQAAPQASAKNERIGADVCLQCHTQNAKGWFTLRHNRYRTSASAPEMLTGCEGCHGPGQKHLEDEKFRSILNPKRETGIVATQMCFQCHSTTMKASAWLQTAHAKNGVNCGGCHEMHTDTGQPSLLKAEPTKLCLSCHPDQQAQFKLNSHHPVLEGRVACTDCHDPHADGTMSAPTLKQGEDRCLKCHQEKRGPFAFEHQTSLAGGDDGCVACHKPHGSANPKLTAYFGRGVCLQCHSDIAADPKHLPRAGNCWSAGCHNRMHGSSTNRLFIN